MPASAGRHAALLAMQRALNCSLDLPGSGVEEAFGCLVSAAAAVFPGADLVAVAIRDGDGLVIQASNGEAGAGIRLSLSGSLHGVCLERRSPVRADDLGTCGDAGAAACALLGVRSLLLIPLSWPGGGAGILQVGCAAAEGFVDDDVLAGQMLAGMLASGLASIKHETPGSAAPEARVLEGCADRVEIIGTDGVVVWINPAGLRLLGTAAGARVIGSTWLDHWPTAHHADAAAAIADARGGGVGRFRAAGLVTGAIRRWWDVVLTRLPGPPGAIRQLLSIAREISDLQEDAERTSLALAAGSVVGIGAWEPGGVSLDDRLAEAFGLPADRMADLQPADFLRRVHPDDHEALGAMGRRAQSASGELSASFRLRAPTGGIWRWVEARGIRVLGEDGAISRMTGVLIDIDARKRVELELAQNEQTVRDVADSMPIMLVYIAPDRTLRFANRSYRGAFGETSGKAAGDPVHYLFGAALEEGPGALLARALAGERVRFDGQAHTRDAILLDLDFEYIPRRGGTGEFDGCYVLGTDITQRKEEERALTRSRLTLEQSLAVAQQESARLWRLSRDLLCVRDRRWRLRSVNPAWHVVLGWPAETLLGGDSLELIHPDDRRHSLEVRRSLGMESDEAAYENRYRASHGGYRWLSWKVVSADGLIYATARDITLEKEAALRLQRVEEQLRQSQKMEAVGQLTGGIAHDFNNLLTGVIGSIEMMRGRLLQGRLDQLGKYMDAASDAAERAASVTHRLLSFSRRQTLEPKRVAADRLIEATNEVIRRAAGPLALVQIVRHRGVWEIFCDPAQLETALLNLVNNARDAMPDGGRLVIETGNAVLEEYQSDGEIPAGEYVAISVTDTGTGMSAEVAARAFDPFFTTRPIGRGTGLGLSMVYGFARQSGGYARIVSAPGRGARVTMYLPRAPEASLPDALEARPGRAVLLVEDEPMVRMLVGEVLGALDCETIEAVDGAGGLRVLQGDRRIDLLITDIGLPGGMNGMQMVDAARQSRPELKVLFITGYAESSIAELGQPREGMQVIGKPFTMEGLMEQVRSMIPLPSPA